MMNDLILANKENFKYILKKHFIVLPLQLVYAIISGLTVLVTSHASKEFINEIIINDNLSKALMIMLSSIIYIFVNNILQVITKTYSKYVFSKTKVFSRLTFSKLAQNLNLSFYDIPENINKLNRAEQYASFGYEQLMNYLFSLFTNVVGAVSVVYSMTNFSWWVAIFLLVIIISKIIIDTIIVKKDYTYRKEKTLRDRKINYLYGILKNQTSVLEVNIYDASKMFSRKLKDVSEDDIKREKKHNTNTSLLSVITFLLVVIQNVVIYLYSGIELSKGNITVGDYSLFLVTVNYLNIILLNFKDSITQFTPLLYESKNYMEIVNIDDSFKYISKNCKNIEISTINEIKFENVSFKYYQKEQYALHNVSFSIKKGDIVSLFGENGSGKSTIIKLLLRMYHPNQGEILINGIPLRDIDIKQYWSLCGVMFQNTNIYAMSLLENISFTEIENSNIENVKSIVEQLKLNNRFLDEKNGIMTELSRSFDKDGTNLSGGEAQKVAFGRAKYRNTNLLLLDEPSSALDVESENIIFEEISKKDANNAEKIAIFVSHRPQNSIKATKIIYMSSGEKLYEGTHEYLMLNCNDYKKLFE